MTMKKDRQELELEVRGMSCDSCALHVTEALRGVNGVIEVEVPGWKSGRAKLIAEPDVGEEVLTEAVKKAGYRGRLLSHREITPHQPSEKWKGDVDYDLTIIGTGGAGMAAAIKAAELGRRVCIIEAGSIGGTCVNIGCVPSKKLMRAAKAYYSAGQHSFAGVYTRAERVNWKEVVKQKDNLVDELRRKKYLEVLESYGDRIKLIHGRARLEPDCTVVLDDGSIYKSSKVVIATGATPKILSIDGIEEVEVLTSTTAMSLDKQPGSLIIIGGRAVALELGQSFARFGTKVTILQRSQRLIPEHEPEIAEALADYLRAEGLTIHTGIKLLSIKQEGSKKIITVILNGIQREFRVEHILMCAGRVPNTKEMGLEEAGIKLDERGFIIVDEFMQTSNPKTYAAGDVTDGPKLVYVAAAGGGIAAENALKGNSKRLDLTVLPEVIFTDPQVARVGLTEKEAKAEGYDVKVAKLPLIYVPRALIARDTRGLIKLVADRSTNRLIGAHILADEAGEIIQSASLVVKFGIKYGFSIDDMLQLLFPYLVQGEGLKLAALGFEKDVSRLSCCAG